jgi:RNA polymerase-binding transcription factor DksA
MATKKKIAAPAKKIAPKKVAKPTVKKSAPKKAVPVKKTLPAKKSVPAKKAPAKKPIKKAIPLKKSAAPAKKTVPAKKAAKPAKPAPKSAPKKMTKPVSKAPVKKAPIKKAPPVKAVKHVAPAKASTKVEKPITSKSLPAAKDIKVAKPKPVVLPKITTKKARPYDPDFTKSILDKHTPQTEGFTMRYSDNELNEFRDLISRKLESAKKELAYLQGLITRKDEMGGDDTDNRYMTMEDGSLSMEREQLSQMASRQITFIDHLEKAIMRIENKTYGICRVTGKLIDKARLRAVPHATLSIEAKMGMK